MYIDDATAKRYGFAGAPQAAKAMLRARRWLQHHNGKRPPQHVRHAMELAKELEAEQNSWKARAKKKFKFLVLRIRSWAGAVPLEGQVFARLRFPAKVQQRLEKAVLTFRRSLRRRLRLYLDESAMSIHMAHVIQPDVRETLRKITDARKREQIVAGTISAVVTLYGLIDEENPHTDKEGDRRDPPREVAARVARTAIAYIL